MVSRRLARSAAVFFRCRTASAKHLLSPRVASRIAVWGEVSLALGTGDRVYNPYSWRRLPCNCQCGKPVCLVLVLEFAMPRCNERRT